ncbi:MAG: hypothetical protein KDC05_05710, partial [Bacteroidales bacterium]|nr:hypothetical protein [Bacteroidales bacterium]
MKRILIYINNLSIDVVIGALMSSLFASRITGVQPEISFWVIFVLAVWVVYSADHLVDALRLKNHAHTHRHRFHFRHFRLLSVLVTVAAITSVSMAV